MRDAQRVLILAGRHTQQPLEGALEMEATHLHLGGKRAQRHEPVRMPLEELTRALNRDGGSRGEARVPRMAAPAGTISRALGRIGLQIERDVRARGTPRRARWAAIDARRAHGVHKSAVEAWIAALHGAPRFIGVESGSRWLGEKGRRHGQHD